MPLSDAEKWLDHLGSCSPCYADFRRLAEARAWRRRRALLAVAAGILLAVAVTGWAVLHTRNENRVSQAAVLDLRDRSPARGAEVNPAEPPLEIARSTSHLKVYLPLGSGEGTYAIRILAPEDKILLTTNGMASVREGITSLAVDVNISSASPGPYVLQIRKLGSAWTSYPLRVK